MAPLKTFRTTPISAIFRQFISCFGLLILQEKHNIRTVSLNIKPAAKQAKKRLAFLPVSKARVNSERKYERCGYVSLYSRGHRGRDRIVVGLTTSCVISA
jgi:hypothetical protein